MEEQSQVAHHGVPGVKRMKLDAATIRRKNGIGQQVIQIQQDEVGFFPVLTVVKAGALRKLVGPVAHLVL